MSVVAPLRIGSAHTPLESALGSTYPDVWREGALGRPASKTCGTSRSGCLMCPSTPARSTSRYQVGGGSFVFFQNPRLGAVNPDTGQRYDDVIVF